MIKLWSLTIMCPSVDLTWMKLSKLSWCNSVYFMSSIQAMSMGRTTKRHQTTLDMCSNLFLWNFWRWKLRNHLLALMSLKQKELPQRSKNFLKSSNKFNCNWSPQCDTHSSISKCQFVFYFFKLMKMMNKKQGLHMFIEGTFIS